MKNLLYIGNKLNNISTNITSVDTLGKLLEDEGYDIKYASAKNNPVLRLLDMIWSVIVYAKKVDFVLIDTYSTLNFYYAVLVSQLCRVLKLPYIPILHGGNLPNRLKKSPKLSQILFKNARINVSPSLYLKSVFEEYGFDNVVYIPNTISIKNYPFDKKILDKPKLLWVRSFSEIYNPTLAVEVLHELRLRGYDASLCMVGPDADGSLSKVKSLTNDLNVLVTFPGKLSKQAWIELSKDYNLFINTTNFDNMPVSVIEAMALGLPVVSTNVGGMPYLIEEGMEGILVPAKDYMAMADAVEALFKDVSKTEAMVVKAREKVEEFDWGNVKGLWEEVLG